LEMNSRSLAVIPETTMNRLVFSFHLLPFRQRLFVVFGRLGTDQASRINFVRISLVIRNTGARYKVPTVWVGGVSLINQRSESITGRASSSTIPRAPIILNGSQIDPSS
jgi:hypothetical protein